MNVLLVSGRLTRDPEMRYTTKGKPVTSFSIAVNTGYGETRKTAFLDCVAWDKLAENVADTARKGTLVIVEGRLDQESYTNRENRKVTKIVCVCRSVTFAQTPLTQSVQDESEIDHMPILRNAKDDVTDDLTDLPF